MPFGTLRTLIFCPALLVSALACTKGWIDAKCSAACDSMTPGDSDLSSEGGLVGDGAVVGDGRPSSDAETDRDRGDGGGPLPSLSVPVVSADRFGWYNTATSVTITAADAQSGIQSIKYSWDSNDACVNGATYSLPIAIPADAVWHTLYMCARNNDGHTGTAQAGLGVNTAASDLYVDPLGDDADDGSLATPWLTLHHACLSAAQQGDKIHLSAGTFPEVETCDLSVGVSIEGAGSASSIIESSVTGSWVPYLYLYSDNQGTNGGQTISGITIHCNLTTYAAVWIASRSNVHIHDCMLVESKNYGVIFNAQAGNPGGPPTIWATGNEFTNNTLNNCSGDTFDSGYHYGDGSLAIGGQDGMVIHGNTINENLGRYGYGIKFYNEGHNKGVKIYDNYVEVAPDLDVDNSWDFAMEFWYSEGGIEIFNNTIIGSVDIAGGYTLRGTYPYGMDLHDNIIGPEELRNVTEVAITLEGEWHDVYVRNNLIRNVSHGMASYLDPSGASCNGLHLYYNVFDNIGLVEDTPPEYQGHGMTFSSTHHDNLVDTIEILNNTFVANSACTTMWGIGLCDFGAVTHVTIRNNIVVGFYYGPVYGAGGTGISINGLSIENNLFFGNGNGNDPRYSNLEPSNNVTQNNVKNEDPLFVPTMSYHLQEDSPAVDAGLDVGLTEDRDHSPVPFNSNPDIGAYEFHR